MPDAKGVADASPAIQHNLVPKLATVLLLDLSYASLCYIRRSLSCPSMSLVSPLRKKSLVHFTG